MIDMQITVRECYFSQDAKRAAAQLTAMAGSFTALAESLPDHVEAVGQLSTALAGGPQQVAMALPQAVVAETPVPVPVSEPEGDTTVEEDTAAAKRSERAKKAAATRAANKAKAEAKPAEPKADEGPTFTQVREAVAMVVQAKGHEAAKDLIAAHGAGKVSALAEADWPKVIAQANELAESDG